MSRQVITFLFSILLIAPLARAGEVARWNRVMTTAAAAEQTDPLTESRVFSIVHAAIHDALNAIERRNEPYREGLSDTARGGGRHHAVPACNLARAGERYDQQNGKQKSGNLAIHRKLPCFGAPRLGAGG